MCDGDHRKAICLPPNMCRFLPHQVKCIQELRSVNRFRLELIMFTGAPTLFRSEVLVAACLVPGNKTLLDSLQRYVLDKRASGLVRFSYKLSIFRIGGVVICGLEAARV
jgi:hypothetical protein